MISVNDAYSDHSSTQAAVSNCCRTELRMKIRVLTQIDLPRLVSVASAPRVHPGCAANRLPATSTVRDLRALCRRSGTSRSNWFHCRRSGCAAPARRIAGTAGHSAHAPPCPSRNAVTFSGKPIAASSPSRIDPHLATSRASRRYSRCHSCGDQLRRQRNRRQPRRMQDLIRIGIADAAQRSRVGQGPLQRAILRRHRGDETHRKIAVEYLDAAGIDGPQPSRP